MNNAQSLGRMQANLSEVGAEAKPPFKDRLAHEMAPYLIVLLVL